MTEWVELPVTEADAMQDVIRIARRVAHRHAQYTKLAPGRCRLVDVLNTINVLREVLRALDAAETQ